MKMMRGTDIYWRMALWGELRMMIKSSLQNCLRFLESLLFIGSHLSETLTLRDLTWTKEIWLTCLCLKERRDSDFWTYSTTISLRLKTWYHCQTWFSWTCTTTKLRRFLICTQSQLWEFWCLVKITLRGSAISKTSINLMCLIFIPTKSPRLRISTTYLS